MRAFPAALERLTEQFARLPGIGMKSAQRLAFYVLSLPKDEAKSFAQAILDAKDSVRLCPVCQNLTDQELCAICADPERDHSLICVVAEPKDVIAMERAREYHGVYHVLHGVISPLSHVGPDDLRIRELLNRVADGSVREVIMATNPDTVGVATAIVSGGPGAIFWMWVMALLGMMTSFAENVLGVYYRRKNEKGEWNGGAMYYLTDGLGAQPGCTTVGRVLADLFACYCILASFGIGNMSQINSTAGNMNAAFHLPYLATGLALMEVTALIVIGGLKRVAAVTEKLVPLMALFYVAGALIIVVMHAGNIPAALAAIFKGAFNLNAAGGGALGYGISQTITWGFKRGAFSNEAGLGSAVMVNSASNVKEPVHQGMWGVFEVFADTIVVCTLTALVILTTGVVDLESGAVLAGVQDNALVGQAFTAAFGSFGPKFIAVSILLFAYSTTLGWSHYGTKAVEYLFGTTGSRIY